ncbi:hypothetical protein [Azospirillum sp.]|uniref:hypothetical protein n=1 Tax=Azospirillum sp. TaxID=34012 RepID=UPI002D4D1904|nr:hypothetical protein [Azospirillum sp.]HYD67807.1 hypothetical protein [Azospirillum sp.]
MDAERAITLLVLGAAIIGVGVALHRQGALGRGALALVVAMTVTIVGFLFLTYS